MIASNQKLNFNNQLGEKVECRINNNTDIFIPAKQRGFKIGFGNSE